MMGSLPGEAGRFNNESPQQRVALGQPFAVGVHEVTRGQYSRSARETGHPRGDACWAWDADQEKAIERPDRNWQNPGFEQTDRHPVVCVNWDDAQAYVRWLSGKTGHRYRLLSESEWEYVARGGTHGAVLGRDAGRPVPACQWGGCQDAIQMARRLRRRPGLDSPRRELYGQRLWSVRHLGQRVGVGAGLLEQELRWRPE